MSVEAMNWAYQQTVGNSGAKSVLVALSNQADPDGKCWPAIDYICQRTELARRSVIRHLEYLEANEFIEKRIRPGDGGGRKSNIYTLNIGKVPNLHIGGQSAKNAGQSATVAPKQSINNQYKRSTAVSVETRHADWKQDEDFLSLKLKYPPRAGNSPKAAYRAYRTRIREGHTWQQINDGLDRYIRYCEDQRLVGTSKVKQLQTFFGPDEHFLNDWSLPAKKQSRSQAAADKAHKAVMAMGGYDDLPF